MPSSDDYFNSRQLADAVDQAPFGILIAAARAERFTYANAAALELLQVDPGELFALPFEQFIQRWKIRNFRGQLIVKSQLPWLQAARTGRAGSSTELYVLRPDENERVLLAHAGPIRGADGSIEAVICALDDITEHKRSERETRAAEARIQRSGRLAGIEQLTAGVAHELNNLLGAILGNSNLALLRDSEQLPVTDHLNLIDESARRAAKLVRQLTAQSAKKRTPQRGVQLDKVVKEMQPLLEAIISKKATLLIDTQETHGEVDAEVALLRQVVINLATNASDALGDEPGKITIRTTTQRFDEATLRREFPSETHTAGRYTLLEVTDDGTGMDAETVDKALQPFFSTKFAGRGLGLPTVFDIAQSHNGDVVIHSTPGSGTTVRVLLPAVTGSRPAREPVFVEADKVPFYGRVLIAEDEKAVRFVARQMLERLGFEVVAASDGQEALELYDQHGGEFRLVLLDLTMPRLNGKECLRELRKRNPSIRILLTSGYDPTSWDLDEMQDPVPFVAKPYQIDALKKAISKTLA